MTKWVTDPDALKTIFALRAIKPGDYIMPTTDPALLEAIDLNERTYTWPARGLRVIEDESDYVGRPYNNEGGGIVVCNTEDYWFTDTTVVGWRRPKKEVKSG